MPDSNLKIRVIADMKAALKAGEKQRLGAIRLILSEIRRIEIDERTELDDTQVIGVLDKMAKQRRDSISQFEKAGRADLVAQEAFEIAVIDGYLPEQMDGSEIDALITTAIADSGAESMKDMSRVMGLLQPQLKGRADMAEVSKEVKSRLV